MNKTVIVGVISFIFGGAIGAGVAGSYCARDYRTRLEALRKENDRLIEERRRTAKKGHSEPLEGIVEGHSEECAEEGENEAVSEPLKPSIRENKEYKRLIRKYSGKDEDDDGEDDGEDDENDANGDSEDIRVVSEQFYCENFEYMDSHSLIFYQVNQILTTADNKRVEDDEDLLSADILDYLCNTKNDQVYVYDGRDNDDETLYDIIVDTEKDYNTDVMGSGV